MLKQLSAITSRVCVTREQKTVCCRKSLQCLAVCRQYITCNRYMANQFCVCQMNARWYCDSVANCGHLTHSHVLYYEAKTHLHCGSLLLPVCKCRIRYQLCCLSWWTLACTSDICQIIFVWLRLWQLVTFCFQVLGKNSLLWTYLLQNVDKRLICDCAVVAEWAELHRAMIVLRWLEWRRRTAVVHRCTALRLHCMMAHVRRTMDQRHLHTMVQQHQAAPAHGILPTPTLRLGKFLFINWTDYYCDYDCVVARTKTKFGERACCVTEPSVCNFLHEFWDWPTVSGHHKSRCHR